MTRTPRADARRVRRYLPLVLILYLCPTPAFAQVPNTTIRRIVDLNVQMAEGRYLRDSNQIDEQTWRLRQDPIATERNTLLQQLRQFSADEQKQADDRIQLLT